MTRKLPVLEAFKRSLYMVWDKRAFAFAISWPYLIVKLLILAIAIIGMGEDIFGDKIFNVPVGAIVTLLSQALLLVIMAIYWHRNILLEDTAPPAVPLRFDAYVLRYFGYALLLSVGWVSIFAAWKGAMFAVVSGAVFGLGKPELFLILLPLLTMSFVLIGVMGRLSLVLPAAAVGDRATDLNRSWKLTAGNTWRICGLYLLIFAAFLAIGLPLRMGISALGATNAALWLTMISNFLLNWLGMLVGLAMLSLVYAWFRHEAQPADAEMAD